MSDLLQPPAHLAHIDSISFHNKLQSLVFVWDYGFPKIFTCVTILYTVANVIFLKHKCVHQLPAPLLCLKPFDGFSWFQNEIQTL